MNNRGLTIHGPGSHNVTSGGSMTSAVFTPRDKLPSDDEVDELITEIVDLLGIAPYQSEREQMRKLIRSWHANH